MIDICVNCEKENELVPKRRICRKCYNKEKILNTKKNILIEREDICTKCNEIKIIPKCKRWCRDCKNIYERNRRSKYSDEKKTIEKQKNKKYYENIKKNTKEFVIDKKETKICSTCNKEKTLDSYFYAKCKGTIRASCKECTSNKRKEYYRNNKEKTIKQTTSYQISRCKIDPKYKLEKNMRCRLYHALKNQKADKLYRTKELVSCSLEELKIYIENLFTHGMSWEKVGKEIHIDHIKPCCSFDLTKEEEQKKCFHFTNLQPLWAEDNLSKGGKWDG